MTLVDLAPFYHGSGSLKTSASCKDIMYQKNGETKLNKLWRGLSLRNVFNKNLVKEKVRGLKRKIKITVF